MGKAPIIAAIDVGTNSFHMVIASINTRGAMRIISREREMVRLGSSGKDMKYLQEDAMDRGVKALYAFSKMAESHDAYIRAVATSAVREALNKDAFIKRVKNELNIEIEVVSGVEEGRLIFLGVIHALPIYDKKILIIDIGGGSTETIIGKNGELETVHSEKIGAVRLTKLFFEDGKYTDERIEELRAYIKGEWSPILNQIKEHRFDISIGTSGTIQSIANMVLAEKQMQIPELLNGFSVSAKEIIHIISKITKCSNQDEILEIPGIDPRRADIILAGALILETAIEELKIKEILLSPYALREGIVYDTFEKMSTSELHKHIVDLRYETVVNLAQRYNNFDEHTKFVTEIALKIFDFLIPIHNLGNYEREILKYSSLLHDIGYWISHDQHHKHSYYIIIHSDLPGFTNEEADIIATIARYHRKSHPKKKHPEFSKFEQDIQNVIKVLAGILRIAEGIDRRQKQYVQDINVNNNNIDTIKNKTSKLEIKLVQKSPKYKIDIEVWGANRRKDLLEESLKIDIEIN